MPLTLIFNYSNMLNWAYLSYINNIIFFEIWEVAATVLYYCNANIYIIILYNIIIMSLRI